MPQVPDIEKVKKEEYEFKKDEKLITPVDSSIETNEIDSILPTDSMAKVSDASEPYMEIISSIVDTTISNEIDGNLSPVALTTEGVQMIIVERKDLAKTVTHQTPADLHVRKGSDTKSDLREHAEDVTVISTDSNQTKLEKEKLLNLSNGGVLEGSIFDIHDDDKHDTDESDEDYKAEIFKTPRPTQYTSKQRSMPSSTLLHGFITNPGYPSFYIGKTSDCKWKLKLNEGQSIALTILDLHLRSKRLIISNNVPLSYRLSCLYSR